MKILIITMISFVTLPASAAIDCDIKIVVDKKASESKAEFKITRDDKESTLYETVKDGYTFKADIRKAGAGFVLPYTTRVYWGHL